jgi:hypothetical protein
VYVSTFQSRSLTYAMLVRLRGSLRLNLFLAKIPCHEVCVVTEVNLYTFLTSKLGESGDRVYASAALPLEQIT